VINSYTFPKESVPKNLQDDVFRIKRQTSPKLAQSNIVKCSPYPDNPDIYYRKGILYSIILMVSYKMDVIGTFLLMNLGNYLAEPTNCNDLKLIGHFMNGFYSVKNSFDNRNIETVFCNFTRPIEGRAGQFL